MYDEGRDSSQPYAKAIELLLLEIASKETSATPEAPKTVMTIGRYKFNCPDQFPELQERLAEHHLELSFVTAHASKGMEADHVLVVGLENGEYGFPSNISDDHVMRMVLTDEDEFPYGEERRLFYVAMTRTPNRTYLVVPHDNVSPFVADDLLSEELESFVEVIGETSARHRCPRCKQQTIKRKEGPYGTFWSCSDWPICLGRLRSCPECKTGAIIEVAAGGRCSSCGHSVVRCSTCEEGILVERKDRATGQTFWACSNWNSGAGCHHTQNVRPYLAESVAKELAPNQMVRV